MIHLGVTAEDVVTGFRGVVTGHCKHLSGCDTYGLTPKSEGGKAAEATQWFDANRLMVDTAVTPVRLSHWDEAPPLRAVGGPQDEPPERSHP